MNAGTPYGLKWKVMSAFLVLLISGCATGPRFTPSHDVSIQFEDGSLLPDHSYYVGGPESKPNAIVAISEAYQLDSDHWRPVTLTPESLKAIVDQVGFVFNAENKTAFIPNGARIVTAGGEAVGVWYSVYTYSQIRLLEGNRVNLSYPNANMPGNLPTPL